MIGRTLGPGGHLARFVTGAGQLFPSTETIRGMLSARSGNPIAVVTLRQNSSPLSYTTLPVREGVSNGKVLPLVPQMMTGITATSGITVDATPAAGLKLTGRIDGGNPALVVAKSIAGEVIGGRIGWSPSGQKYILFLVLSTNPIRYRPMMLVSVLEKATAVIAIPWLYVLGRIGGLWMSVAAVDLVFGVLFLAAYRGTARAPSSDGG